MKFVVRQWSSFVHQETDLALEAEDKENGKHPGTWQTSSRLNPPAPGSSLGRALAPCERLLSKLLLPSACHSFAHPSSATHECSSNSGDSGSLSFYSERDAKAVGLRCLSCIDWRLLMQMEASATRAICTASVTASPCPAKGKTVTQGIQQ